MRQGGLKIRGAVLEEKRKSCLRHKVSYDTLGELVISSE